MRPAGHGMIVPVATQYDPSNARKRPRDAKHGLGKKSPQQYLKFKKRFGLPCVEDNLAGTQFNWSLQRFSTSRTEIRGRQGRS